MHRSSISCGFLRLSTLLPLLLFAAACSDSDSTSSELPAGEGGGVDGAGAESAATGEAGSGDSGGGSSSSTGDAGAAGEQTTHAGATGDAQGPAPVDLGMASQYVIVAKSAISNVPTSVVTGDLALSPAAATYITGFALTKAGTSWTSPQVIGLVFAANNDPPTPARLTTAIGDMQAAYADAAGRSSPDFSELEAGKLGGLTLAPGLYNWSSSVTIATDVTLAGDANDVWIFQVSGNLELSAAKQMLLSGGAQPQNVFWQVAGSVAFGTTSHAEGVVLGKTAIKLSTGASINGRLLAQTAVTIAGATVTAP